MFLDFFHSLIKWKNIVCKTCDNYMSPNDNYSILQEKVMCLSAWMCEYVSMCVCICIYIYIYIYIYICVLYYKVF